jgi:uncharacterized membrane protein YgdD (TMEM256/DUF423 family)
MLPKSVNARLLMSIAATYGLVAVLLGAFAAHGLKEVLSASSLASWQTGVTYQMTHALVLLVIGLWLRQGGSNLVKVAGVLFAIGVLVFSGSIYALVLLQVSWLGPVTPLGGLCLIAGWGCMLVAAAQSE